MVDPRNRAVADLAETLDVAARDIDRIAERIASARSRISARSDLLEVYGAAALVSGYYSHLERAFERIVRDLSPVPLEGPDWHRRLLRSMSVERPGVRPAVLDITTAERLDELLAFRHLFRNLYVLDLRAERVADLIALVAELHPAVSMSLRDFSRLLAELGSAEP
jgi:hypothetical protein